MECCHAMRVLGHKRWAVLVWVGIVVIAIAAGLAAGLATHQKTFTVQKLRAHWKAPYDLVVFPKGHALPGAWRVMDPNTLDAGTGGITVAQYHRIQHLAGVALAAPLAPIGYLPLNFGFVNVFGGSAGSVTGGVYRVVLQHENAGLPAGTPTVLYADNGGGAGFTQLPMGPLVFVMAVDPTAEAQLMGLRHAVVGGHYFTPADSQVVRSKPRVPPGVAGVAP